MLEGTAETEENYSFTQRNVLKYIQSAIQLTIFKTWKFAKYSGTPWSDHIYEYHTNIFILVL